MNRFRTLLLASLVLAGTARAQAIRTTDGLTLSTLVRGDDNASLPVATGFGLNLFGTTRTQLTINTNGSVSFGAALSASSASSLASLSTPVLAPFFADVDTRATASGQVRFGGGIRDGRQVFAVNWIDVGYFNLGVDRLNSFQLWLVDRGSGDFDFEFNYGKIQWDVGLGGQGGRCVPVPTNAARAGWANGSQASFELAGSGTCNAFLDGGPNSLVAGSLNSDVAGRYLFSVRNGQILGAEVVPEPSTSLLMATGLAGLAALQRRRRRA